MMSQHDKDAPYTSGPGSSSTYLPERRETPATSIEIEMNDEEAEIRDDNSIDNDDRKQTRDRLSRFEWWNLICLLLAFACTICSTTMIVGASAVVVKSVGGGTDISPFSLGCFFLGAALVSLVTSPLFDKYGRKPVFLLGNVLGLLGAGLGAIAVIIKSSGLVIVSTLPLGCQFGIGNYLRFAAVEVVPPNKKAFAVTLVLSGGVIAAFVGPEASQAPKDMFGDDLEFLGLYMMVAIFNVANILFVSVATFPEAENSKVATDTKSLSTQCLTSVLFTREFMVPASMGTLSWAIMAMPMSIVRVTMNDVGYSFRQSLTVIELHFLGMYLPGFITGKVISKFGAVLCCFMATIAFVVAIILNLVSLEVGRRSIATWYLGLIGVGIGWNFGFSGSTVKLTEAYKLAPALKTKFQASNDFCTFLLAGGGIFSTGYIYEGGKSGINGWRTVNYVVLGLAVLMVSILLVDRLKTKQQQAKKESFDEKDDKVASEKA